MQGKKKNVDVDDEVLSSTCFFQQDFPDKISF